MHKEKSTVYHLRIPNGVLQRLRAIAELERRDLAEVMRLILQDGAKAGRTGIATGKDALR